ncbi:phospholipase domain-containing protein [Streptomyces sp. NPDC005731]|uniref:phospholipase domain-containing protein n=1 Tax=Streptomyces sp. NPDC005731 TaxID=3157056 RepID=UPI0033D30537
MANQGVQATESVHFSVYAGACRNGGPWQYTVGRCNSAMHTDGQVEDYFNVGSGYGNGLHDLTVVGPDRFLRRFTGNALGPAEDIEVGCSYAAAPTTGKQAVRFRMTDRSPADVTSTITSGNYRGDGRTHRVTAGNFVDNSFNAVAHNGGWYDFTVTVSSGTTFSRRFVGHLETGAPSVTGRAGGPHPGKGVRTSTPRRGTWRHRLLQPFEFSVEPTAAAPMRLGQPMPGGVVEHDGTCVLQAVAIGTEEFPRDDDGRQQRETGRVHLLLHGAHARPLQQFPAVPDPGLQPPHVAGVPVFPVPHRLDASERRCERGDQAVDEVGDTLGDVGVFGDEMFPL